MAIYEYFCPNCREVFEVVRPMKRSNEPASCPRCNAKGEKLPSVFASTADSSIKVPDKDAFRENLREGRPKSRQAKTEKRANRRKG
jgi:putative FmdB family regulatory protein